MQSSNGEVMRARDWFPIAANGFLLAAGIIYTMAQHYDTGVVLFGLGIVNLVTWVRT